MAKEMLINVSAGEECRIAVVENGKLEELYMERASAVSHVGNVYKGKVTNVEASIQAAFVDFGIGRNGFLHISDVMPTYFGRRGEGIKESVGRKMARRDRPPIQQCLRRGDEIIVQVIKEGLGTKGPTLSSYLSIPGRILVMMPGVGKSGVSKKIEDEDERRRLRKILDELDPPKDAGFIIRTAGVGKAKAEIERDFKYLMRLWDNIQKADSKKGPLELYAEGDLVMRTVRDVYTSDIERIVVDDKDTAKRIKDFFKLLMPRTKNKVEVYDESVPLFHEYKIERDIEMMHSRTVPLKSGGSLVIDQTEAVVAIDVNSGKSRQSGDAETTAFRTDMEAADEIPRQLKLRDLGGVVICDFIDLRYERHRRELEARLAENLKLDRAKTRFLQMSEFGIIEMTRQRMRPSLEKSVFHDCPSCAGQGLVKSPESMGLDVVRSLTIAAHDERVRRVELSLHSEVAIDVLNRKRIDLAKLEEDTEKRIVIKTDDSLSLDEKRFELFDEREGSVWLDVLGMEPPQHGSAGREGRGDRPGARGRNDRRGQPQRDDRQEDAREEFESDGENEQRTPSPAREPDTQVPEESPRGRDNGRRDGRGRDGGGRDGGGRGRDDARRDGGPRDFGRPDAPARGRPFIPAPIRDEADEREEAFADDEQQADEPFIGEPIETASAGQASDTDDEDGFEGDANDRQGAGDDDRGQSENRMGNPLADDRGGFNEAGDPNGNGGRRRRRRRGRRGRGPAQNGPFNGQAPQGQGGQSPRDDANRGDNRGENRNGPNRDNPRNDARNDRRPESYSNDPGVEEFADDDAVEPVATDRSPDRQAPRRDEPRRDEPRRDAPRRDEPRRDGGRRDEPRRDGGRPQHQPQGGRGGQGGGRGDNRGNENRGNDSRGNDSRGNDNRGNDRGNDNRGNNRYDGRDRPFVPGQPPRAVPPLARGPVGPVTDEHDEDEGPMPGNSIHEPEPSRVKPAVKGRGGRRGRGRGPTPQEVTAARLPQVTSDSLVARFLEQPVDVPETMDAEDEDAGNQLAATPPEGDEPAGGDRKPRRRGGRGRGKGRAGSEQPQGRSAAALPPLPAVPKTGTSDAHVVDGPEDNLPDLGEFLKPSTPADLDYLPEYEDDE